MYECKTCKDGTSCEECNNGDSAKPLMRERKLVDGKYRCVCSAGFEDVRTAA